MAAPAWTRPGLLRAWLLGTTALLPAATGALAQGVAPNTLPTGGQVSAGSASITQSGAAMQVTQGSNRAAINWQGFSVGANASVNFQQPNAGSWTLNRVTGADPSVIAGRVTANGGVAIVNQSGVVFAAGAQVNVGSLIASAANITNDNFMAGKMVFDGPPRPGATVENHGSITIADRGLAALVGPRVANSGTIRARLGRVALAGAETFSIDLAGDGLLSIDVTQAVRTAANGSAALVTNSGVIEANGGSVLLSAHAASGLVEDLVRNTGHIAANTAVGRSGQVALRAEGGGVRVDGSISAAGRGRQTGGSIEVRGSTATTIAATATLNASGGAGGGRVLVGTTGVGRDQRMSATTTVERGARLGADARRRGNGGIVAVNSTGSTVVNGSVSARGGRQGGNGGLVELSGQDRLALQAQVDLAAPKGKAGTLLLDPQNITVVAALPADPVVTGGAGSTTATPDGANTVSAAAGTGTTFVTAGSLNALDGAGITVQLQAKQTIAVEAAISLASSTLNLFADGAITQTGAGTITVGTLVIRGFAGGSTAAGSATLGLANTIGTLDAIATGALSVNNGATGLTVTNAQGSAVTLTTTGGMALNGAVGGSGAAVVLNADGTINQTGGSITAASLTVRDSTGAAATAGNVVLHQTNSLASIDIASSTGLTLNNDGTALAVAGLVTPVAALGTFGDITFTGPTQVSNGLILFTNGNVAQSGTGTVSTLLLSITDRSASTATPGFVNLGTLTNAIDRIDIQATGAVAVNNGGNALRLDRAAGSGIAITAGALDVAGAATITTAGGTISLRADTLAWGALLDAGTTGTLEIGPRSNASTVSVGAGGAGSLKIDPGSFDITRLIAGTLTLGETTIDASTVRGNGLTVSSSITPNASAVATGLRLVADAGTALSVEAPIDMTGRAVSLLSSGSVGQTASGKLFAGTLTVGAPGGGTAGAVTLNAVANALGRASIASSGTVLLANDATALTLGGLSGTGATITSGGSLTVDGAIGLGAGTLNLFSTGAISQASGVITAGSVVVRDATGAAASTQAVALDGASNAIAAIDIATAAGVAVKNGATDLAVTALSGSGATLTTGGALNFAGAANLGAGTLTLRASGAVTQANAAVITAATLNTRNAAGATSAAAVTLDAATNAIGSLDGATTAAYALKTSAALTVTGLQAQSATLTSAASIAITGATTVANGLALNAPIMNATAVVTAGSLTLRGADGVAAVTGSIGFDASENAIGALDAKSATAIRLRNGTTDLVVNQAVAPTVLLEGHGALSIAGLVDTTGGTGIALRFDGAVTSTATASLLGPVLTIFSVSLGDAASIDLSLGTHGVDAYSGHASGLNRLSQAGTLLVLAGTGSTVDLASTGGALTLGGAIGGGGAAVTLAAQGDLTQPVGSITASTLAATSIAGKLDLQRANAVDSASLGAGTTLDFKSANALTVTGASGTLVALEAPSLGLTGAVGGTTRVQLTSTAGGIGQSGAGLITTPDLRLTVTGGNAALTLANAVDQFRASAAGRTVDFTSANDLTLAGTVTGTTVTIIGKSILAAVSQNPSVALDLSTTAGSITQAAGITLRAATMNFTAVGGDIQLGSGDHIAANASFTALGHAVAYTQVDDPLTVTGASAATIAITAPGIELAGATGATNSLALTTTAGAITQTAAGVITTPRLTATAVGGAVLLDTANDAAAGNAITQLGAAASGDISVVSRTALEVDAAGIGVTAAAGGTIALVAPSLAINQAVGFAAADAGNRISLTADALTATAAIDAGASGRVAIQPRAATRGIDIGGATAGTLQLGAATLGHVTAGRLLISAAGTTGIGVNADLALAGVGVLELLAGTGIAQDHATGITVASLSATAAAGGIDLGGANQIGAIAGSLADPTTGLAATGGITLVDAAALAVGAKVLAGNAQTIAITATGLTTGAGIATTGSSAGNRIDLRADTVVLGADVSATGGVINILPDTSGRAVRLGGADGVIADTLYLPSSQFQFIQAGSGLLRIGGTATATTAGTITLGGEVPLRASVSGGAVVGGSAATLDLRGAAVATDPAVVFGLNVATLTGTTSGGFRLNQPGNAIDSLGAISGTDVTVFSDLALTANGTLDGGPGRVILGSGGQLTLAGDIQASTGVILAADAAILQSGGRIVAPVVEVGGFNVGATAVTLLRAANDFGSVAAEAGGAVQILSTAATAGTLSLAGPVTGASIGITSGANIETGGGVITATGGAIALTATGTLGLGNALVASGDITLLANAAAGVSAITQTAGTVQSGATGTIGMTADSITLLAAPNSIRTGAAGTGGLVLLRPLTDGRAITLGGALANTLSIASGAGISAGRVLIGRAEAGAVNLAGSFGVGAATLELITAGAVTQAGGTVLTAAGLSATAGGATTLDGQNLIDAVVGSTADPAKGLTSGGGIALTTARAGGLTTSAAIAAANGAGITLRADALALGATIGAGSGSLAVLNILPNTAGTAVTLGADAAGLALNTAEIGFLRAGTGTLRIGGDGSGVTAGAITVAGDVLLRGGSASAAVLDLRGDSLAQTAGVVAVATLTGASTAGGFALDGANQIDGLGLAGAGNPTAVSATGGPVAIASTNALTVRGDVTAAAAAGSGTAGVSLRGNGLAIGDGTAPAKTVLLQAGRGDLVLDAGSGPLTIAAVTTLRAQDPVSLAAEGTINDAFGSIRLNGGTVTLAGTLDAGRASGGRDIVVTSTAALDSGAASLTARRDIGLTSTAGGITVQAAASLSAGRDIALSGLGTVQVDGTLTADRSIGVTSTGGTVNLTGTATAAASGPVLAEAGAGITISGLGDVALDGSLTATGRSILATTTTGTLTVNGMLSAATGGSITLNATGTNGRAIVAAAGSLAGGAVAINAGRQLQHFGSLGGTDITLTVGPNGTPLSPAFEAGSGSSIIASGALGITANSGNIGLTAATLQAGTTLGLTAGAGSITQTRGSTTAAGAVTLQAATGIAVTAGGGTAPVLRSTGASLALTTSGGDIALTEATVSAATTLGLTAGAGSISQTRGTTTAAGTLIWQAATGIGVTNGGGTAPQVGSTGGSLAFTTNAGDLVLTEATVTAATTLDLTATAGAIRQTGGTTSGAGEVTLRAGTDLVIAQGSALGPAVATGLDTVPVLRSTGAGLGLSTVAGDIALTNATLAAFAGISGTAGTDAVQGGNIAISGGSVIAGTSLALTAVKGSGGAHAGTLTATDTTLTGGTTATLLAGGGLTATGSSLQATAGAFAATATTGTLLLDTATVGAGTTLGLTATAGDLTQTGGSITAGSTLTLASGGDTTQLAGGRIIAPVLTGSAGGSVSLINGIALPAALVAKPSGNSIAAIAGYAAGGDLTLASNATPLQITGLVSAGTGRALRLFADDYALTAGLAAPGGSVTFSPYTRDGSIALVLGGPAGSAANTLTLDSAELALLPVGGIGTLRFGRTDNPAGLTDIASVTIAGAADLGTGAGTRVGRLELDTRGAITQNAGTSLVVPLLTATAGGSISLDPGSSANRIGGLAGIRTPGSFSLRTSLVAGEAMTIGAGSFDDGIRVGSGQSITLRADDLDIAAAVRAPGGSITLMADTAGRGITLGGSGFGDGVGTLWLSAAELLLLGGDSGGSLASGAATLLRIDATTVPGNIAIAGTVDLQGPTARFQALELLASGNVAGSGGAITVPVLRATVAGNLVLDNAGNSFLLNRITAANATIRQAGDLRLANALASLGGITETGGISAPGGTVRLIAGGTITQDSGATIVADTLALSAANTVTLTEANAFGTLADVSILGGGASSIRAANYTVTGPVGVTGGLTLLADTGLGAAGSIGTSGALALTTTLGDIVLNGATVTAGGGLAMTAGSSPTSGGDILVTGGSIGVTGAAVLTATRDGTLANPGSIGLSGTAVTASTDLTLAAGGGITADTTTLAATNGAFAATAATGSIGFTGTTAGGGTTATLAAATGLTVTGGGVAANGGALAATTTAGDLALDTASLTATGSLGLTATAGAISQRRGTVSGGGAVTLQALGGITVTADGGTAPILRSTGSSLAITSTQGNIGFTDATVSAGGALTVTTTPNGLGLGALAVTGGTMAAGGTLRLDAADTITLTGGSITGVGAVTLLAQNAVLLQKAGSPTAPVLRSTGGGLSVTSAAGDVTLRSADVSAAGALALTATLGQISIGNASTPAVPSLLTAGTDITLSAGTSLGIGPATLTATGGAISGTAGTVAQTGGDVTILDASLTAATTLGLVAHAHQVGQAGADGRITIGNASPTEATILAAGTGLSLTAPGNIALTGTQSGGVFSTRLGTTAGALQLISTAGAIGLTNAGVSAGGALILNAATGLAATTSLLSAGANNLVATTSGGALTFDTSTVTAATDMQLVGPSVSISGGSLAAGAGAQAIAFNGTMTLAGTSLTAATNLTLQAAQGLSAAGTSLAATAGTLGATAAAGNLGFTTVTATAGGTLNLTASTGAVTLTDSSATAGGGATLLGGTGVGLAGAAVTANGGPLGVGTVAGDIGLTNSSLTGNGNGGTVTVTAGTDAVQGGDVTIAGSTLAGRSLTVRAAAGSGGANAGDLTVTGSSLTGALATGLQAGGTLAVTGGSVAATAGVLTIAAVTGAATLDGTALSGQGIGIGAGGLATLRRGSATSGAGLSIGGGTGVTITADGGAAPVIAAGPFTVTSGGGDILLTGAQVQAGATEFRAGNGGVLGGDIGISGGSLSAASLVLTAIAGTGNAGTIGLGGTTLSTTTDGGATLTAAAGIAASASTLAVTGALAATTAAGAIGLDTSIVTATGALALTATTGAITQRRGSASGAGDTVLLAGTGITVTADGGAAPVLRSTGGALSLTTAAGDIGLTGATLSAATSLGLTATAGAVAVAASGVTAGTDATLAAGTSIGVTGSGITATAGAFAATATGGAITLDSATIAAGTDATLAAGTDIGLTATTVTATGGALVATARSGAITLATSSLAGGSSETLGAATGLAADASTLSAGTGLAATTAAGALTLTDSTATAGTTLALAATTGLLTQTRGSTSGGGAVTLRGGTGITIADGGGAAPILRSTGGSLGLATTAGDIVLTGATLSAAGGLTGLAGTNALLGGDIAISRGSLTAGAGLALAATGGSGGANAGTIALAGTSLTAGTAQGLTAGGGLSVAASSLTATAGALAASTAGGNLLLDTAMLGAGTTLGLTATTGSITQRRGSVTGAGDVTLLAGSGIAVTSDGGAGPLLRSGGGALAATSTGGDIGLTGVTLAAATGLGLAATTGAVTIAGSTLTAGTSAALAAGTGIAVSGSTLTASTGAMSATATSGGIALANSTLAAATGQVLQTGGAIGLAGSTLTAGGAQSLTAGDMLGAIGSSLVATGNQAFAAGTGLTLVGTTVRTQGSFAGTASLGAATLTDATLAAAGTLSLTATAGAVTQTRGSIGGGGDTRLRGGTNVTVTDAGSGTAPSLRSTGGALGIRADAGNVVLANARLAAASGLGIAAGGSLGATDSSLATAAGTLGLAATAGDLSLLRSGLASTAGDLDLTAGGAGTLTTTSLAAPAPGGRVRVVTGGPLTLRNLSVTADVADFEAGRLFPTDPAAYGQTRGSGVLVNDGVTATIGTKLLFAGPGGITDLGLTLVLPRAIALPAVIYDTRLNPAANPLTQVQPDVIGLPANQQATQVRSAPGALSPGAFGLPDQNTAAGAVAMNVNAGQSAVFLLVDGGNVQGNIIAGRLGVHGAGGGMSIFGTLGDSPGAQAARFADITRPIAASDLQRYRINGCVISSVNCVVPPSIQIIPPRPSDRTSFRIENNRINTSEVLIPNIAEEDDDE